MKSYDKNIILINTSIYNNFESYCDCVLIKIALKLVIANI